MSSSSRFFVLALHFVIILLQKQHSNAFIDFGDRGSVEAVVFEEFSSQFREPYNLLYFKSASLVVYCQLRNRSSDTQNSRNVLVNEYSSQGMAPTITIVTLGWSKSYFFNELIQDEDSYWKMNISKEELSEHFHEESKGRIPWQFRVELGQGLNLFESWGNLIIPDFDPLFSVEFGDSLSDQNAIPVVEDVIVWQHPCTPGFAVLVPVFEVKESFTGCYMAVTHGSFTSNTTLWYDLLHRSSGKPDNYSICKESSFASCERLLILDLALFSNRILLVTSKGVLRSESINEASGFNKTKLQFHRVSNIHPIIEQAFKDGTVERDRIKLHHTAHCDGQEILITEHAAHLVYTPAGREHSILLLSEPPFDKWSSIELPDQIKSFAVLGVTWDIQRATVVLLMKDPFKVQCLVAVLHPQTFQPIQAIFRFPNHVNFKRINLHVHTHVIFVYGSQVWLSLDGGNSFKKILDTQLRGDFVSALFTNPLGDAFALVTSLGAVYSGWSGIPRVSRIEPPGSFSKCSIKLPYFQHHKSVNIICVQNVSSALKFNTYSIDLASQIKADRIVHHRPLLVHFVSERKVEFFAFCGDAFFSDQIGCSDSFQQSDVGRVVRTKSGGSALITEVHDSKPSSDFSAPVTALVIKPFGLVDRSDSPALHYTLQVNITGSHAELHLQNSGNDSGWRGADIGKTVLLFNGVSLILTTCISLSSATGRLPTSWDSSEMYTECFEEGMWYLMDFRPFRGFRPLSYLVLQVRLMDVNHAIAEKVNDQFSFSRDFIGHILKFDHEWGLITSVNDTSVEIMNPGNLKPGNYTNNWGFYQAQVSNDSYTPYIPKPQFHDWWLAEDDCRHFLVEDPPSKLELYHLDSGQSLNFTLRIIFKGVADNNPEKPLVRLFIGKPSLFYVKSSYRYQNMNHTLRVTLTKRPFVVGISSVSVRLEQTASLLCKEASYTVHGGCPPDKKLRFLYPTSFSLDAFLDSEITDSKGIVRNMKVPSNYRTPSSRGKAIPMSENAYNVDPQKPLYKTTYTITRMTLRYKQCKGKKFRSDCGCTRQMRGSSLVEHSDCIDTVYRVMFSEKITPRFVVSQEHKEDEPLRFPFYLEELNQRKDFIVLSPSDLTFVGISSPVLEQSLNSSIQFEGSGLYHFRAQIVQENYTFGILTDEFVVFVVDAPLPFPVKDVVRACTGMGFASLLFIVYIKHFHRKKKMKND
ncbi:cation channel sperm-associated protein subunit beta-like [Stylophora pistillata]|uniref:cation channel sperm-associated protein subunit beta-like n=1 Tax=Stylophora pistillata TaxID=50429 RepID=UPI000C044C8B|nr:cation channel sperm-associated protein subunit beta-like [Stylophora pistillata]